MAKNKRPPKPKPASSHQKSPRRDHQSRPRPAKPSNAKPSKAASAPSNSHLYGHHAVQAALANPNRQNSHLLATSHALKSLEKSGISLSIPYDIGTSEEIGASLPQGAVHQGLALKTAPLPEPHLADACENAPLVVILDQVTDPHNVGAILRSCAVFGAKAVIMTERHSPPQSGVLAKSASGALEHVALVRVTNLARAMEELKKMGFQLIGLDGEAETDLPDIDASPPVVLVMGAEGAGLRRLTRENCDWLAKLPAKGPLASLNVSNAAAVALYEVSKRL